MKWVLVGVPLILLFCLWLSSRLLIIKADAGDFSTLDGGWTKAEPAAIQKMSTLLQARPNARKIVVNYRIVVGVVGSDFALPAQLEYSPSSETLWFHTDSGKLITCTRVSPKILRDVAGKKRTMDSIVYPDRYGEPDYDCKCDDSR